MAYTLGQAAKAVGKSKATLQVALKKGRIAATQDEKGVYHIEADELFRVYPPDQQANRQANEQKTADERRENSALAERLKVLEELVAALKADKQAATEREAAALRREGVLTRDLEQWRGFAAEAHQRLKALEAQKPPEDGRQIIEAQAVAAPGPAISLSEGKEKKARPWWLALWPWSLVA